MSSSYYDSLDVPSNRDDARGFDLNIEKILEDWETHHALREIIANAIDEETLSGCKPTEIIEDSKNRWHIRRRFSEQAVHRLCHLQSEL